MPTPADTRSAHPGVCFFSAPLPAASTLNAAAATAATSG